MKRLYPHGDGNMRGRLAAYPSSFRPPLPTAHTTPSPTSVARSTTLSVGSPSSPSPPQERVAPAAPASLRRSPSRGRPPSSVPTPRPTLEALTTPRRPRTTLWRLSTTPATVTTIRFSTAPLSTPSGPTTSLQTSPRSHQSQRPPLPRTMHPRRSSRHNRASHTPSTSTRSVPRASPT